MPGILEFVTSRKKPSQSFLRVQQILSKCV